MSLVLSMRNFMLYLRVSFFHSYCNFTALCVFAATEIPKTCWPPKCCTVYVLCNPSFNLAKFGTTGLTLLPGCSIVLGTLRYYTLWKNWYIGKSFDLIMEMVAMRRGITADSSQLDLLVFSHVYTSRLTMSIIIFSKFRPSFPVIWPVARISSKFLDFGCSPWYKEDTIN